MSPHSRSTYGEFALPSVWAKVAVLGLEMRNSKVVRNVLRGSGLLMGEDLAEASETVP